jgi:alpha-glucosidase
MLDHLGFWFRRGIDGFRIDVLWMLAKDDAPWRDGPITEAPLALRDLDRPARGALQHGDGPDMEDRLAELRDAADAFPARVLIGEVYMEPERLVRYYGRDGRGAHLPFNFALVTLPWEAGAIGAAVAAYEAALPVGAWPNWVLGNHDQARVASRVGPAQARVAAMLLLTLRGTPTVYYGDELGLPDVPVPAARIVDVAGRDPERSPMPWTRDGAHAGFSAAKPWLPMVADAGSWSVEAQRGDLRSMLALHRRLLALRRSEPALHAGGWTAVGAPDGVVAFDRTEDRSRFRVALNLTAAPVTIAMAGRWTVALSTRLDRDGEPVSGALELRADEGVVLRAG